MPNKLIFYGLLALALTGIVGFAVHAIRDGGKEAQKTEQRKVDDAARVRIKAVPPGDNRSTIERLSHGTF